MSFPVVQIQPVIQQRGDPGINISPTNHIQIQVAVIIGIKKNSIHIFTGFIFYKGSAIGRGFENSILLLQKNCTCLSFGTANKKIFQPIFIYIADSYFWALCRKFMRDKPLIIEIKIIVFNVFKSCIQPA